MIATFIIDWPVLIFIGILFGGLAPRALWWRSSAFIAGAGTAAAFTAVALISYAIAPDWMWMYFFDAAGALWVVPGLGVAYLSVFALSFAAGVSLQDLGKRAQQASAAVALVGEIAMIAVSWDRYHLVGYYRGMARRHRPRALHAERGGGCQDDRVARPRVHRRGSDCVGPDRARAPCVCC